MKKKKKRGPRGASSSSSSSTCSLSHLLGVQRPTHRPTSERMPKHLFLFSLSLLEVGWLLCFAIQVTVTFLSLRFLLLPLVTLVRLRRYFAKGQEVVLQSIPKKETTCLRYAGCCYFCFPLSLSFLPRHSAFHSSSSFARCTNPYIINRWCRGALFCIIRTFKNRWNERLQPQQRLNYTHIVPPSPHSWVFARARWVFRSQPSSSPFFLWRN